MRRKCGCIINDTENEVISCEKHDWTVSSAPVACSRGVAEVGESGLLPCPFCGGSARLDMGAQHCHVSCRKCVSRGKLFAINKFIEAKKHWNTRNGKSL